MQDKLHTHLDAIEIPDPSTGAAARVVSQAKHMQRNGVGIWWRFNRFRAWFFQLHMRYVVMACVVLVLAFIGRVSEMQDMAAQPKHQYAHSDTNPLEGVAFAIEDWANGLDFATDATTDTSSDFLEFEVEHWADTVEWMS